MEILADDIYAYDSMLVFLEKKLSRMVWEISEHSGVAENLGTRSGEYRILVNNIYGSHQDIHPFAQRAEMLTELYREYDADILALQEYNPTKAVPTIEPMLEELGYTVITAGDSKNYVPLLYKANKFTLVASGFHRFADGEDDTSKAVTWAVFSDKSSGDKFAVASTHFAWKSDADAARVTDAEQLAEVIASIKTTYGCPVIFGGDFNCNTASDAYKVISNTGAIDLQAPNNCTITDTGSARHSYPTYNEAAGLYENPHLPIGDYTHIYSIDHIFADNASGISFDEIDVVTDLYALLTSDHCPMVLDFSAQ